MAKNISNKKNMSSNNRSHSCKATKTKQKVNLQTIKLNGKKVRLSASEIRTMKKA